MRSPVARRSGTTANPSATGPDVIAAPSLAGDRLRGRVGHLQRLPVAQVHVHAAGQAGVEAADRAHDVDALEVLPVVLLEDRLALDGVLVGAGRAEAVPRAGVPGGRRGRGGGGGLPAPGGPGGGPA